MLEKKHLVFLAGATAPFAPPLCTALDTTLCSLRREALPRGAPEPRMTGRGHKQFQRELLTSKRPS